jgi:hypothetical protein
MADMCRAVDAYRDAPRVTPEVADALDAAYREARERLPMWADMVYVGALEARMFPDKGENSCQSTK